MEITNICISSIIFSIKQFINLYIFSVILVIRGLQTSTERNRSECSENGLFSLPYRQFHLLCRFFNNKQLNEIINSTIDTIMILLHGV